MKLKSITFGLMENQYSILLIKSKYSVRKVTKNDSAEHVLEIL